MLRLLATLLCLLTISTTCSAAEGPPALSQASRYHDGLQLSDYRVSEKLDGVRAYWNGETLLARSGHPLAAPQWFTSALPDTELDGELWLGRGRFDEVSGLVRRLVPEDKAWRNIRFMIFDLPFSPLMFSERLAVLRRVVANADVPWLQVIPQFRVVDAHDLQLTLDNVISAGGEGLMLRRSDSLYHNQRNDDLLKLKPLYDDEAVGIAHIPGQGRLAGMMGSLLVEDDSGLRFRIGTGFSDEVRRHPPPPGATITFQFNGLTARGVPRFARYLRVRDEP